MLSVTHIKKLLEISDHILAELETKDPSITIITQLFGERASYIDGLRNTLQDTPKTELDTPERNEAETLFKLFQDREMVINRKLITLREHKKTLLKKIYHDRKVQESYKNKQKQNVSYLINEHLQG